MKTLLENNVSCRTKFTDVPSTEWYAQNVQAAYEYKLVDGVNATQFKPNSNLTIAQAIKLAACLHSTYVSGTTDFETARPWYQPYVTYALENGIINTTYADYDRAGDPSTVCVHLCKRAAGGGPDRDQRHCGRCDCGCGHVGRLCR